MRELTLTTRIGCLWLLVAAGCDGTLGGGKPFVLDASIPDAGSDLSTTIQPPADPCDPLPAGCLCADACQQGQCDNSRCPCEAIDGVSYGTLSATETTDRPAAQHPDLNLLLRSTRTVQAQLALVDVNGPTDPKQPPQLYSLFADDRVPTFVQNHQIDNWDWGRDRSSGFVENPEVTLAELQTTAGEVIHTPISAYDIGDGHTALVLYAADDTITLKYTREDNVVRGYTIHLAGICIEPGLRALYEQSDRDGRGQLPALRGRQPLGRARGTSVRVAIRDTGNWMDPRVRKDWWQGR